MASKMINLRLDERLLGEVDKVVSDGGESYASRTDFIRDAVRRALQEYRTQRAARILEKYYGYGKKVRGIELTDEEIEKAEREAWKRLSKKYRNSRRKG